MIGAYQEESFGIRQNHSMYLADWKRLMEKYFPEAEYEAQVQDRGWGERVMKRLAIRLDPHRSAWHAARWLGGMLVAVGKKPGSTPPLPGIDRFEELLRCPDCGGGMMRDAAETLHCHACPTRQPMKAVCTTCSRRRIGRNSIRESGRTTSTFACRGTRAN